VFGYLAGSEGTFVFSRGTEPDDDAIATRSDQAAGPDPLPHRPAAGPRHEPAEAAHMPSSRVSPDSPVHIHAPRPRSTETARSRSAKSMDWLQENWMELAIGSALVVLVVIAGIFAVSMIQSGLR